MWSHANVITNVITLWSHDHICDHSSDPNTDTYCVCWIRPFSQAIIVVLWLSHGCHIFMSHCRSFSMLMSVASSLLLPSCLGHYSVFSESSESFCVFWVSYALCASIYAISTLFPPSIFSTRHTLLTWMVFLPTTATSGKWWFTVLLALLFGGR